MGGNEKYVYGLEKRKSGNVLTPDVTTLRDEFVKKVNIISEQEVKTMDYRGAVVQRMKADPTGGVWLKEFQTFLQVGWLPAINSKEVQTFMGMTTEATGMYQDRVLYENILSQMQKWAGEVAMTNKKMADFISLVYQVFYHAVPRG